MTLRKYLNLLVFFGCFIAAPSYAQGVIGVVDVSRILSSSEAAKSIEVQRQQYREQFLSEISQSEQKLRTEEKTLLEERSKLSKEEYAKKHQAYEARLIEVRKMAQGRKKMLEEASGKAMDSLRNHLYEVVQAIANERGFELVISKKNVIAGKTSLDITEETMKRINEAFSEVKLEVQE